jgi:hypothetical protein
MEGIFVMMTRRFLTLLILCLSLCLPAASVRAQSVVTLSELKIAFWPEYDRQAMLIIYRGTLSPDTPLPASLKFDIPARYGPPLAVAFTDNNGQLLNLDYTTSASGDTITIAFDAPTPSFQFEYYDTSLDLSSTTRRYSFATAAPYAIQTLNLEVQQPVDASGLAGTPTLDNQITGADGLIYFSTTRTGLAMGDSITLDLTYTKSTDVLTASAQGPVVTPDLPPATTGTQTNSPVLVVSAIAGVVGVLLVVGGIVWYTRNRSSTDEPASEPRRRSKPKGQPPRPKEVTPKASVEETTSHGPMAASYCHECGSPIQPDDQFCSNCGTKVRR